MKLIEKFKILPWWGKVIVVLTIFYFILGVLSGDYTDFYNFLGPILFVVFVVPATVAIILVPYILLKILLRINKKNSKIANLIAIVIFSFIAYLIFVDMWNLYLINNYPGLT